MNYIKREIHALLLIKTCGVAIISYEETMSAVMEPKLPWAWIGRKDRRDLNKEEYRINNWLVSGNLLPLPVNIRIFIAIMA